MRLLRFVLTSLAVVAGLIGAFAVLTIGLFVYVLLRLFGRPAERPTFRRMGRTPANPAPPAYSSRDQVIDVVATKVE
ncbi:MAG TPA: hypothetical protein VG734_22755 [Lacunisphaera sp.]|nr:hypothetical protein [Lacunisphaera sp.]